MTNDVLGSNIPIHIHVAFSKTVEGICNGAREQPVEYINQGQGTLRKILFNDGLLVTQLN